MKTPDAGQEHAGFTREIKPSLRDFEALPAQGERLSG